VLTRSCRDCKIDFGLPELGGNPRKAGEKAQVFFSCRV
jgi:hypothetical protein